MRNDTFNNFMISITILTIVGCINLGVATSYSVGFAAFAFFWAIFFAAKVLKDE